MLEIVIILAFAASWSFRSNLGAGATPGPNVYGPLILAALALVADFIVYGTRCFLRRTCAAGLGVGSLLAFSGLVTLITGVTGWGYPVARYDSIFAICAGLAMLAACGIAKVSFFRTIPWSEMRRKAQSSNTN